MTNPSSPLLLMAVFCLFLALIPFSYASHADCYGQISCDPNLQAWLGTQLNISALSADPSPMRTSLNPPSAEDDRAAKRASSAIAAFAGELFHRTAVAHKETNVVVSPFSVAIALAVALEGARGDTAREIRKALGYDPDYEASELHQEFASLMRSSASRSEEMELAVANALWMASDLEFDGSFVARAKELMAEGRTLDFRAQREQSRRIINAWVEKQTQDKIKDLLPPDVITSDTALVSTNAIYFKGRWSSRFYDYRTRAADFHLLNNGATKRVDMMSQKLMTSYNQYDDHAMVELAYRGLDVVMLVLLPHENTAAALDKLCSVGSVKTIGERHRLMTERYVELEMPKFKFEFDIELKEVLQDMGINKAFTNIANFSAMVTRSAPKKLKIGSVVHKAFVEVNEEGTTAAAATGMVIELCSGVFIPPVKFVVDRPFVFVLYHTRLEYPLFIGKVLEP